MANLVGRTRRACTQALRRTRRRISQVYLMACARDDAAAQGLRVPSGVWVCERCEQALLELASLREHERAVHLV